MTPSRDTTQYLYGNPGNPFQLTASRATDNTLTIYSYDTSGNLFAFERAGTRYYVATDQLGTPKVVTYDNGTIVKQAEYDAWGVKLSDSAPSFDLPVGFAGGIPEHVTGLVRFGFRDYEPGTGRWVAKDPIQFEGGQGNLYGYVGNSPATYSDPSGLLFAYWHFIISLEAGLFNNMGVKNSIVFAWNSVAVDLENGSFDDNAENTVKHSMGGNIIDKYGKIRTQTEREAIESADNYIAMHSKKSRSDCNVADLPHGAHAAQDYATPMHKGHSWANINKWGKAYHFLADVFPSPWTVFRAFNNTMKVLR